MIRYINVRSASVSICGLLIIIIVDYLKEGAVDEFTRRRYVKIAGEYRQILQELGFYPACVYIAANVPAKDTDKFKEVLHDLNSSD